MKECKIRTIFKSHILETILNNIGFKSWTKMNGLIGEADSDGNYILWIYYWLKKYFRVKPSEVGKVTWHNKLFNRR